jgi:hypothetical protein
VKAFAVAVLVVLCGVFWTAVRREAEHELETLPERVLRWASRLLRPAVRERYLDEWLADLDTLPALPLRRLVWAVAVACRAPRLRRAARHVRAASETTEAPDARQPEEGDVFVITWPDGTVRRHAATPGTAMADILGAWTDEQLEELKRLGERDR